MEPEEAAASLKDEMASAAGEPQPGKTLAEMVATFSKVDSSAEQKTPPAKTVPKEEEEGKKLHDVYSGRIQEASEELYATLLRRSEVEEGFLDTLVTSKDPLDRKYAAKILKRNEKKFGAGTLEDYMLLRAKAQAGSDKEAQNHAELSERMRRLQEDYEVEKWESWKQRNSVLGELNPVADQVRKEHPNLPFGDVLALAKGRMGIVASVPTSQMKQGTAPTLGSGPVPIVMPEPSLFMKKQLRITERGEKFAREYLPSNLL